MRVSTLLAASALFFAACDGGGTRAEPGTPTPVASSTGPRPEQLFLMLGCTTCHAKGAPYEEKIRQAKGKSAEEVAEWILDPQKKKPGTPMPTFSAQLSESQARRLATWVLAELDSGRL